MNDGSRRPWSNKTPRILNRAQSLLLGPKEPARSSEDQWGAYHLPLYMTWPPKGDKHGPPLLTDMTDWEPMQSSGPVGKNALVIMYILFRGMDGHQVEVICIYGHRFILLWLDSGNPERKSIDKWRFYVVRVLHLQPPSSTIKAKMPMMTYRLSIGSPFMAVGSGRVCPPLTTNIHSSIMIIIIRNS